MEQLNQRKKAIIINGSGAIISFRIQEFPSLSSSEQTKIIHQIQQIFDSLLELTLQGKKLGWSWIKYLDGSFTFFLGDSSGKLSSDTQLIVCMALAIALKLYEYEKKWPYTLTIALHWGDDVQIVNSRSSLQVINGQTLSVTHHTVSFAEFSPILIARQAFEKMNTSLFNNKLSDSCERFVPALQQAVGNDLSFLFPTIKTSETIKTTDHYYLQPITLLDHQQRKTQWYAFVIEDTERTSKFGNRLLPMEQVSVGIYDPVLHLAQQNDAIDNDLVERLIWSDEIILIGTTHHLLPEALIQAFKERRTFWRKIQVVYPNRNNVQRLIDEGQMPSERLIEWGGSKKHVKNFFLRHAAQLLHHWECLECIQDLPFIGSRYVIKGQAYIRFAPLLLGSDPRNTMQITISSNIVLFDQISHAIDTMVLHDTKLQHSASLTEWDLLGQYDQSKFHYRGIINLTNIANSPELAGLALPVVLFVLYVETLAGTRVVLQERTIYNSINDAGSYSNISGRICTDDVVSLHPGHFWVDSANSNIAATNAFNDFSNLSEGDVLDEIVWQRAAIRNLQEELGLDINPDRLEKRSSCYIERENENLFFQIFSLKLRQNLKNDELALIQQRRPYAALKQYRISELWHLYNEMKLNHLFQAHFTDLFLPLFQQIHIAP